jgi:hypothetical protein
MRKVIELHTVKIGRLEVRYKNNDRWYINTWTM